jgi:hypothetical protein
MGENLKNWFSVQFSPKMRTVSSQCENQVTQWEPPNSVSNLPKPCLHSSQSLQWKQNPCSWALGIIIHYNVRSSYTTKKLEIFKKVGLELGPHKHAQYVQCCPRGPGDCQLCITRVRKSQFTSCMNEPTKLEKLEKVLSPTKFLTAVDLHYFSMFHD